MGLGVRDWSRDQGPQPASGGPPCTALPGSASAPPGTATAPAARCALGRGEFGKCGARRPRGLRLPETRHRDPGRRAMQALRTRDRLPETTGTAGWRKEGGEAAAISCRSIEQPGGPSLVPNPAPARGSAQNLKIKLVFGREERARPRGQAAPGCRREEMLRHGANMDAGLLSFFSLEEPASPGAPKSWLRGAETPQSNGNEILGRVGRFPRIFSPSSSKALQFLPHHQGSDLRRAKGTSAGSSMDALGYWGDAPFAFGAEEAKGSGQSLPLTRPLPSAAKLKPQKPQLPIIGSPWPA